MTIISKVIDTLYIDKEKSQATITKGEASWTMHKDATNQNAIKGPFIIA